MKWIGTQTIYDHVRLIKGITLDSVSITTIQTSSESFADNDTSLMTSAAVDDRINTAVTAEDLDVTADEGAGAAVDLNSQALAITGGTGITTSATGQAATINVDAAQSGITSLGTLTGLTLAGSKSVDGGGDGAMIHLDGGGQTITDADTAGSGTATKYTHVNIETPRLAATNSSVTTTDAATLYISGAPAAHTNQTITNPWALWVDAGAVKFDSHLTVGGTITGDVTGALTGQADTVATIAGLAPNTATTQATQPNIDSIGTDGDTLSILGDTLSMYNASANAPNVLLVNNADDSTGPFLTFANQRKDGGGTIQDGEDDDVLGHIFFQGYDDGTPSNLIYANILADIHDATSGQESGRLTFKVANHDGGLGSGLILTGGSADNEIDVTLGLGAASVVTIPGDVVMYNTVNDGNPTFSMGSSASNRFEIKPVYNSGTQILCDVDFTTYTTSGSTNDGRFNFYVDEVLTLSIKDELMNLTGSFTAKEHLKCTDNTTSSATQGGKLILIADDGAVMGDDHRLGVIEFQGAEDTSSTSSIGARIQAICRDAWDGSNNDADLEFYTTDGTTESKVLTLDADKLATFAGDVKCQSLRPTGQLQTTYYMFRADIDTTKTYIGLQEADGESTSATNKNLPILTPVAGKLLKVFLRANTDLSGNTLTWRLELRTSSQSTSGTPSGTFGTQSGAGCTASSMTTYDFTSSLDAGSNAIAAGDTVQLSIQSDSATANTTYYVTCLWEWDFSSIS